MRLPFTGCLILRWGVPNIACRLVTVVIFPRPFQAQMIKYESKTGILQIYIMVWLICRYQNTKCILRYVSIYLLFVSHMIIANITLLSSNNWRFEIAKNVLLEKDVKKFPTWSNKYLSTAILFFTFFGIVANLVQIML